MQVQLLLKFYQLASTFTYKLICATKTYQGIESHKLLLFWETFLTLKMEADTKGIGATKQIIHQNKQCTQTNNPEKLWWKMSPSKGVHVALPT